MVTSYIMLHIGVRVREKSVRIMHWVRMHWVAITIFGTMIVSLVSIFFAASRADKRWGLPPDLVKTGVAADAVILEVREMGLVATMNKMPLAFVLEVRSEGRSPYRAKAEKAVPFLSLHKCEAGSTLRVLVDPKDPSRVAIVGI